MKRIILALSLFLPLCAISASPCPQPDNFPANEAEVLEFNESAMGAVFSFKFDKMKSHLENLKTCFSDEGWQSYQKALKKSETLENIEKLKLNGKASVDSQTIKRDENNLWVVTSFLSIEYQNKTHFAKQKLKVVSLIADADKELKLLQLKASEISINDDEEEKETSNDGGYEQDEADSVKNNIAPAKKENQTTSAKDEKTQASTINAANEIMNDESSSEKTKTSLTEALG